MLIEKIKYWLYLYGEQVIYMILVIIARIW